MPRRNPTSPAERRVRMGYSHVHPSSVLGGQSRTGQSQHTACHPHGQVQTNHTQYEPMPSPDTLRHVGTGYSHVHPSSSLGEQSQAGQSQHNTRYQTQYPHGQVQTNHTQDEPIPSPDIVTIQPRQHQTQYSEGQVQTNHTQDEPIPSPDTVTIQPRQHQTKYPEGQVQTNHTQHEPELSPIIVTIEPRQHQTQYSEGQVQTNHTQYEPALSPIIVTIEPRQHQTQYPEGQIQTDHTQYEPALSPSTVKIEPRQHQQPTHHADCHSQQPSQHHQPNPHPSYPNPIPPDGSVRYILPNPGRLDGFIEEEKGVSFQSGIIPLKWIEKFPPIHKAEYDRLR